MSDYDQMISRQDNLDPLVPTPVSAQILQELPEQSAMLNLARTVTMSTKSQRQPVLSLLPDAFWVAGNNAANDNGLKKTTKVEFENLELVAEELAVIVPLADNYISDAQVPLWDVVRPLIVQAFGKKIDEATMWGIDKPSTWTSPAIIPGATAAGNVITAGTGDIAQDVANVGFQLSNDGFNLNGFASRPGYEWILTSGRSAQGVPLYQPGSFAQGIPSTLYGRTIFSCDNGAWQKDKADLVGGQWSNAIIGMRQDISFKVFDTGVITDSNGEIVYNLLQQDMVALRATMRIGYAVANPITTENPDKASRFPFAVLTSSTP